MEPASRTPDQRLDDLNNKEGPQSPFAEHFHTNYSPTPSEVASIKRLIDQRQVIVDGIDEEIAELDRRHEVLVEKKRPHIEYIDTHRQLISPARRLHSDALLAIFLILVSDPECDSDHGNAVHVSKVPPAVIVSQVCSQWRDIAMHSPLLWSYINIFLPRIPIYPSAPASQGDLDRYQAGVSRWKRSSDLLRKRVETIVERSQGCPLHISICGTDSRLTGVPMEEVDTVQEEYVTRVVRPLVNIREKKNPWKAFRLHLKMAAPPSPLVTLLALTKAGGLNKEMERLELDLSYECPGSVPEEFWGQVEGQLDLQDAPITSLTARMPFSDISKVRARWDLLTSLSTGSPNCHAYFGPQEAVNVLNLTRNLIQCTIEFFDIVGQTFSPQQQTLSLPKLEDLTIRGSVARVDFAALLDTPSLTRLSAVHPSASAQCEDQSAIVELVRRYGSQLTDVSLTYSSLTQTAFSFVLGRLVAVTSLCLYAKDDPPVSVNLQAGSHLETQLDAALLQRLTPSSDRHSELVDATTIPDCFCPKLQTLICVLGDEQGEDTKNAFIEFIEARRKVANRKKASVGPLEKVDVTFWVGPVDKMIGDLEGRGIDTFGIAFRARYPAAHLTPYLYQVPIPGIGTISISMDHNHQY